MEIEKEIKQTVKFTSEYHKLSVNILYTASWLEISHTKKLKPYGLTPQQFNLLRILRGQHPNPATVNMLIERMIDKSSNASRLVDRLEQKGFVNRCTSVSDKRSVNVRITDKGLDTLKKLDEQYALLEEPIKSLSKDEARELNRLLDKLRG
ncbi:MAG: MarR family transcriptional regulator [Bacteroidota bacterium]|nr:MarR family transcriptional regulator [Bacteroidota bacterium]